MNRRVLTGKSLAICSVALFAAACGGGSGNRDTTVPAVTVSAPKNHDGRTAFDATIRFSENVTGFERGDVTASNARVTALSGSGASYRATLKPGGGNAVRIDIAASVAQDAAGNGNTAATRQTVAYVAPDTKAPTAAISAPDTHDGRKAFSATIRFSENVTGFDRGDVKVARGKITAFSASGATAYRVTIEPSDGANSMINIEIPANVAQDAAGNGNSFSLRQVIPATFTKSARVFGVPINAKAGIPDIKVRHAATVMAEYLDNDEDGKADNPAVVEMLVRRGARLLIFASEADPELPQTYVPSDDSIQALFSNETLPNGRAGGRFDATLEEVLHLITHVGYAHWKPKVFGTAAGSNLANAMDAARGGRFEQIPTAYPQGAWFTYDDESCNYGCMVTEYLYWALTSLLGAQDFPGRSAEINAEWRPHTQALLKVRDARVVALLTDPANSLPTRLPDGNYRGSRGNASSSLNLNGLDRPLYRAVGAESGRLLRDAVAALPNYKIAYGDENRILMANPDGSGETVLAPATTPASAAGYVAWGPRAQYVYFASNRGAAGSAWEAFRVDVRSKALQKLSNFGQDVRSLSVSPDGRYLAVSIMTGNSSVNNDPTQFNTDLYIVEMARAESIWGAGNALAKSDMRVLVSSPPAQQFWYEELHWNPVPPNDGELPVLAYTQTWRYDEDAVSYSHAWIIKPDGTEKKRIRQNSDMPVWDFSGTRLGFLDLRYHDFSVGRLFHTQLSQMDDTDIASVFRGASSVVFSPDGQFFLFEVDQPGNRAIGLAGFGQDENPSFGRTIPGITAYEPRWSPRPVILPVANEERGKLR